MNFLSEILAVKSEEVKKLRQKFSRSSFESEEYFNELTISFTKAINNENFISVIAEIKKASPSKGILIEDFNHLKIAEAYIESEVNAISVLTDQKFFQGDISYLSGIAKFKTLPLLRKDFIIDEFQILEAKAFGADAVLLICEALSQNQITELTHCAKEIGLEVLLEFHSQSQIAKVNFKLNDMIGINNRNLETFAVDINSTLNLLDNIPNGVTVVSESGITSRAVLDKIKSSQINAVLVGEHFIRSQHIKKNLSQFKAWCVK
ncbi:MAG: indole-3-glycerol phosphate synthase [Ignavibacteria bacterium]|nr:MAG: indole-3-glycerol phosphate synthase [Ignavibacteria bacterium]KAF0161975.1 MAG: indole-3-glycerol phosphate synthase [Ignavibacteria bacterium]